MEWKNKEYGPTVLRVVLGLLFIIPGLSKLANPDMIIGMLSGMGFAGAAFWGWVLLLAEIIFGITVLLGWRLKMTVWPLVIVMLVAIFAVTLPSFGTNPMAMPTLLFHIAAVGGLVSLYLTGPGALAVKA